jgi:hypothetical protein
MAKLGMNASTVKKRGVIRMGTLLNGFARPWLRRALTE